MMESTWQVASRWIIAAEGGYVNDPRDPGGETKYGISKRSYPHLDIKNLTVEQALAIYRRDFYEKACCHLIETVSPALALVTFDCAVLQGPQAARLILQEVLAVKADGVVGPNTLAALRQLQGDKEWIAALEYLLNRIDEMDEMPPARFYMVGWCTRIDGLRVEAKSLYLRQERKAA